MQPNHYDQGGFSVWDIIKAFCPRYAHLEFCAYQGYLWGNVVKYILRCGWKENLDGDLEKAANYLQRLRQYREQLQNLKKQYETSPVTRGCSQKELDHPRSISYVRRSQTTLPQMRLWKLAQRQKR
jgi:Protein of unknwon function (DUF3310)